MGGDGRFEGFWEVETVWGDWKGFERLRGIGRLRKCERLQGWEGLEGFAGL